MKKNKCPSSIVVNVTGDNNKVTINNFATENSKKKKSFKTWSKALGKLIHSAVVNISVLLLEIFTNLR